MAPLGTYTEDFDWRLSLKKGDLVDVLDSSNARYGVWYTCTILETRANYYSEEEFLEVEVGYRVYDEKGDKRDSVGAYFGWNTQYDEWVSATSTRLLK
jgi:hypothetical protein